MHQELLSRFHRGWPMRGSLLTRAQRKRAERERRGAEERERRRAEEVAKEVKAQLEAAICRDRPEVPELRSAIQFAKREDANIWQAQRQEAISPLERVG